MSSMAEQIGRIEKPAAERFKQGKKLYLIPLMYANKNAPPEFKEKVARYWQQVAEQLVNLEAKIGKIEHVYHESISQSSENGMKVMEKVNPDGYQIATGKCGEGAVFEAIEDKELLDEAVDWERCILLGFVSKKVASKVSEFYVEALRKRYEFMVKKISETLKDNEAGLLFITESHQLQFPADIEVFNVFPPALDEINRWLRDRAAKQQTAEEQKGNKD